MMVTIYAQMVKTIVALPNGLHCHIPRYDNSAPPRPCLLCYAVSLHYMQALHFQVMSLVLTRCDWLLRAGVLCSILLL